MTSDDLRNDLAVERHDRRHEDDYDPLDAEFEAWADETRDNPPDGWDEEEERR